MYSLFGSGVVPSYSAAKGALVQLTKSMAIELAPSQYSGERNRTWLVRNRPDGFGENEGLPCSNYHGTDTGRWGNPDECAGAAVFWRPEHPILSLALPSALTAVILSGES